MTAVSPEARLVRGDNRGSEGGGDDRIDGVAAARKNLLAHLFGCGFTPNGAGRSWLVRLKSARRSDRGGGTGHTFAERTTSDLAIRGSGHEVRPTCIL